MSSLYSDVIANFSPHVRYSSRCRNCIVYNQFVELTAMYGIISVMHWLFCAISQGKIIVAECSCRKRMKSRYKCG